MNFGGRPAGGKQASTGRKTQSPFIVIFTFSLNGHIEREKSCEQFELFLKTMHQALNSQQRVSIDFGVVDGEVVLGIRSFDRESSRIAKQTLRNGFDGIHLKNQLDNCFDPPEANLLDIGHVTLVNDVYSIRRWKELLSESDPLSLILAGLTTDSFSRFRGHISFDLRPISNSEMTKIRSCFNWLQSPALNKHLIVKGLVESWLRSNCWLKQSLASMICRIAFLPAEDSKDSRLSPGRNFDRLTDLQIASNKLNELCFSCNVTIKIYGRSTDPKLTSSLIRQLFAPFAQFSAPRLARFELCPRNRRQRSFLISCEELASIVHLPTKKTERLAGSRVRLLEPPRILPLQNKDQGIMTIGRTCFHSQKEIFGLKDSDAGLHGFAVGSSGSGKTTLLQTAIQSLVKNGQGITLVDFHGDFAKSVEHLIDNKSRQRIVRIDATARSPISFNPLACPDKEMWPIVTDAVLTGIRTLFDSWGPRLEQILSSALSAAVIAKDTNLLDVRRMLYDEATRARILARVNDELVREFWFSTFESWDRRFRTEAIQSVVNKLDALLTPKLRAMFCQNKPSFDFRSAFDSNKIVLINLARGQLGHTAARTLGSFVLSSIQQAALSRANVSESERIDHTVFLDELQLYSNSEAITSLLAEARKYRVSVFSATQSLSSIDHDGVLPIVMANAANFFGFRVSHADAVTIAPLLDNIVSPEDLTSLPRFHAYARIMVDGEVQRPFSFTTIPPSLRFKT